MLLTKEENEERWRRGITVEDWFAAPRAPTRGECQGGPRPCAYLRCRRRLDDGGCAQDIADEGAQTQERVGDAMGVSRPNAIELIAQAIAHANALHGRPSRRALVVYLANLAAANDNSADHGAA